VSRHCRTIRHRFIPSAKQFLNSGSRAAKQLAYRLVQEVATENQQDAELKGEAEVQLNAAQPQGASGGESEAPPPVRHAAQETLLESSQQAESLSHDSSLLPLAKKFLNMNARRKESRAAKQLAYRLAQEAATENGQDTELKCEAEVQSDHPVRETPLASSLRQAAAASSSGSKVCTTEPLAMPKSERGYKKKQPDRPRDAHCVLTTSANRDLTEGGARPGQ
jgi:hypothetical protein